VDNALRAWVQRHGSTLEPTTYGQVATFSLWVPEDELPALRADLAAVSAGALEPVVGEERVVDVPDHGPTDPVPSGRWRRTGDRLAEREARGGRIDDGPRVFGG
jgi:hypothetical protein